MLECSSEGSHLWPTVGPGGRLRREHPKDPICAAGGTRHPHYPGWAACRVANGPVYFGYAGYRSDRHRSPSQQPDSATPLFYKSTCTQASSFTASPSIGLYSSTYRINHQTGNSQIRRLRVRSLGNHIQPDDTGLPLTEAHFLFENGPDQTKQAPVREPVSCLR